VFAQRVVDQALIVGTPSAVYDRLKMLDNVVVEPNGDSRLSRRLGDDRTSPGLAEIVLPLHLFQPRAANIPQPPARVCVYSEFSRASILPTSTKGVCLPTTARVHRAVLAPVTA
jgi:hypothetical protein